jgi:hypothetical protein
MFKTKKAEIEANRTREGLENPASYQELKDFRKKIIAEYRAKEKASNSED